MRLPPWVLIGVAVATALALAWWAWEGNPMLDELPMVDMAPAFSEGVRQRKTKPRIIVIHHSDTSSPKATRNALRAHDNSTHFEVDKDGKIYRYLDPATAVARHAGANWANSVGIGIDVTHRSKAPWPPAQVAATAKLVRALCEAFDIPRGVVPDGVLYADLAAMPAGTGTVRHRNVRVGGTACPEDFPMDALGPVAAKAKA